MNPQTKSLRRGMSLIEGMISKKGRPFKAFLACKPGEKRLLSWEFPPREPKVPGAKKKAASKFGRKTATPPPAEG